MSSRALRAFFCLRCVQFVTSLYLIGAYAYFFNSLHSSGGWVNHKALKPLILGVFIGVYTLSLAVVSYSLERLLSRRYFLLFGTLDVAFFGALIWLAVSMSSDGGLGHECLVWLWDGMALGAFFADDSAMGLLMKNCRVDKAGYAAVILELISFVFSGFASGILIFFFSGSKKDGSIKSGKSVNDHSSVEQA